MRHSSEFEYEQYGLVTLHKYGQSWVLMLCAGLHGLFMLDYRIQKA